MELLCITLVRRHHTRIDVHDPRDSSQRSAVEQSPEIEKAEHSWIRRCESPSRRHGSDAVGSV